MFTEDKVTEIFCTKKHKYHRSGTLSKSVRQAHVKAVRQAHVKAEVMVIPILFHGSGY